MKHKIVFFDMDGTLYQTENDVIQESALDAIQTLKDKGYIVCAATGRPLNQMKLILQRVQFDYYVLINGSYILDKDFQEIGSYPILQDNVNDLVNFSKKHETGLMFHFGDATYISMLCLTNVPSLSLYSKTKSNLPGEFKKSIEPTKIPE